MNEDLHTLSGAYALHALPERDAALFEAHMARCEACAVEVRGLSETAARLAVAAAETPPAALRGRVMARIAEVRQEPPLLDRPEGERRPGDRSAGEGRPGGDTGDTGDTGYAGGAGDIGDAGERRAGPPSGDVARLRPQSRGRRVAIGLAAAASAAAVALGVVTVDAVRERDSLQQVVAVMAAPDARTVKYPVPSGGTCTMVVSRSEGRMVFTARGLPPLPESRVYELWLMSADGARPAGLLERGQGDATVPLVTSPLKGDRRVGLTVEPAGGSERPTTTPIMVAALPSV
ncbi:anti-sigma factor [Streptosporangium sp. NPDC051022]|uniref:anti-sigma factor n=1 Tax=Streptosporangium sp. NPDC051022 TaxID=3155752 RepID=UPI003421057D